MTDTREYLRGLMGRYTTDNVEDPIAFRERIDEFLAMDDWEMEGYTEEEKDVQREKSVKFQWGHNHDFGDFQIDGAMGDRHIEILATFIDNFGLPRDLTGKKVLDVGVWCGGTSLLLAAMGATVWYIEEVLKYTKCVNFLIDSFKLSPASPEGFLKDGISKLSWKKSIYDEGLGCAGGFDYIIFPGVLYHLSDPILALRILFNALKDGGELFLETAVCEFSDPNKMRLNFANGKGSNIFIPSYPSVVSMLEYVGFVLPINGVIIYERSMRGFFTGKRLEHRPMLKAGLSRRIR